MRKSSTFCNYFHFFSSVILSVGGVILNYLYIIEGVYANLRKFGEKVKRFLQQFLEFFKGHIVHLGFLTRNVCHFDIHICGYIV